MSKEKIISFDNLKEYDKHIKKWIDNKIDKKNSDKKIPKNLSDLKNDCNFITESDVEAKLSKLQNNSTSELPIGTIILLPSCVERPDCYLPCNEGKCLNTEFLFDIMYDDIPTEFVKLSRKMAGDNIPRPREIYLPNYNSPEGTIYYIKYK